MKTTISILYNQVVNNTPDELDVLQQRDLVKNSCEKLGHTVQCVAVGNNLMDDLAQAKIGETNVVFNLVEAAWGKGELLYVAPAMLNALKIPYTGVPLEALFISTNKVLAKKIMRFNKLPTADFYTMKELNRLEDGKTYIAKPIWEEASVGISEALIFNTADTQKMKQIEQLPASHYFVEEFIDGREFNISLLADDGEVEVLPPAEMVFSDYFATQPKIVGYKAKWEPNSEEFKHTSRAFGTLKNDTELHNDLIRICKASWSAFHLKGYARIDFRVDKTNRAYILEINGNPCIAPDSGFVAAIEYAGHTVEDMIERILNDAN